MTTVTEALVRLAGPLEGVGRTGNGHSGGRGGQSLPVESGCVWRVAGWGVLLLGRLRSLAFALGQRLGRDGWWPIRCRGPVPLKRRLASPFVQSGNNSMLFPGFPAPRVVLALWWVLDSYLWGHSGVFGTREVLTHTLRGPSVVGSALGLDGGGGDTGWAQPLPPAPKRAHVPLVFASLASALGPPVSCGFDQAPGASLIFHGPKPSKAATPSEPSVV